ncbi:MAG: hypothetical protein KKF21_19845 [Bacteroidetes bacterium]|nr:hypothetical protein [Bacteroidota bacterium]
MKKIKKAYLTADQLRHIADYMDCPEAVPHLDIVVVKTFMECESQH